MFPPVTGYAFTHFGAEAVPLLTVAVSALAAADFAAMMAAARSDDFLGNFENIVLACKHFPFWQTEERPWWSDCGT